MGRQRALTPRRHLAPSGKCERVSIAGTWHYLPGPPRSKAANAEFARLLAVIAEDPNALCVRDPEQLVLELLRDWETATAKRRLKSPSEQARVKTAKRLFGQLFMQSTVREFKPKDLLDWQNWLCTLKRKDNESRFTIETIRKFVGVLRKAFDWGVVQDRVEELQAASLDRVAGPEPGSARRPTKRKAVRDDVVDATLPRLPRIIADMLRLIRATSARPHEIYALRPCDVVHRGELTLPASGQVVNLDAIDCWGYLPPNKVEWSGKDRVIVFDRAAQKVLAPYLDRSPLAYCFSPKESAAAARGKQSLLRGPDGTGSRKPRSQRKERRPGDKYTAIAVCKAIKRACTRAGLVAIPLWTPYQLRHRALQDTRRQFGLEVAQAESGHASSATTEARYAPPMIEAAAEAKGRGAAAERQRMKIVGFAAGTGRGPMRAGAD